jgi:hypothetical protein
MIIKYDNKAIKCTNKWISVDSQPTPPTIYQIYTSGTNGSVAALPTSGISGTEVTLSNTPDTGYQFDSYSVTGATLKNTNQFDIGSSDVYVHGNFTTIPVDYVRIGNLLWKTTNVNINVPRGMVVKELPSGDTQCYYNPIGVGLISRQLTDGWRIPTYDDFIALSNADVKTLLATPPNWSGTNTTGFDARPFGVVNNGELKFTGTQAYFYGTYSGWIMIDANYIYVDEEQIGSDDIYCSVRLCKNAT